MPLCQQRNYHNKGPKQHKWANAAFRKFHSTINNVCPHEAAFMMCIDDIGLQTDHKIYFLEWTASLLNDDI